MFTQREWRLIDLSGLVRGYRFYKVTRGGSRSILNTLREENSCVSMTRGFRHYTVILAGPDSIMHIHIYAFAAGEQKPHGLRG